MSWVILHLALVLLASTSANAEPHHLRPRAAPYALQKQYTGKTFFDDWIFFDFPDPSHGLVNYTTKEQAFSQGLAFWTSDGIPGIQVDRWDTTESGAKRNSVRIHSMDVYNKGLFIVDLLLMPWGCGIWPSIWTLGYGAKWPSLGELDIVEGIMGMQQNRYSLHSEPGCTMVANQENMSGYTISSDCDSSTGGYGCSVSSSSSASFGEAFNAGAGGVFAMLWRDDGFTFWDWTRSNVPPDINQGIPDPSTWGTPAAIFPATSCNIDKYFKDQQLVMNVDLCGDWAGGSYDAYSYCPATCAEQVANPANLINTIFLVNNISVYQPTTGPVAPIVRVQNLTTAQMAKGPSLSAAVPKSVHHSHAGGKKIRKLGIVSMIIVGSIGLVTACS